MAKKISDWTVSCCILLAGVGAFANSSWAQSEVYSAEDPNAAPTNTEAMNMSRVQDKQSGTGIPLTGRVFTDAYVPSRELKTSAFRQLSTSLWLEGSPALNENSSANFILQADLLENGNGASVLRASLREGYVRYGSAGFEIRAGRQIIPWGGSDAINPTDFLSAKDYTFFNPDDEVRRIGHGSALAQWTPGSGSAPLTLSFVWTPIAPQSRLLINPSSIPAGLTLSGSPVTQPQTLSNSETALRASFQGKGWDGAVTLFRGWTHLPHFMASGPSTFFQTFQRRRALGFDGSYSASQWVLRAEAAYNWMEQTSAANPVLQPSYFDAVVGAERPLWGDVLRGQAQLVWRQHSNFVEALNAGALAPLAAANALVLGYQFRRRVGATLRLSYAPEGKDWSTELFTMLNITGGDYLFRPKVSYAFTPVLKGTLGTDYYAGPANRPLGALAAYNSVFLEGKYTF